MGGFLTAIAGRAFDALPSILEYDARKDALKAEADRQYALAQAANNNSAVNTRYLIIGGVALAGLFVLTRG